MSNIDSLKKLKCVVFIAHPGHELRIHRFLEIAQPLVHVLTDGSGSLNQSRLHSTRNVLAATGAREGGIFGRYTDRQIYDLLLKREFSVLIDLAGELAESLVHEDADLIAGDMVEGYNSAHDVCRLLVGAAVGIAAKKYGRRVSNYDFPLVGIPDRFAGKASGEIIIDLDASALERKLHAARNYPELSAEVENALKATGKASFMREVLRPVGTAEGRSRQQAEPPYYESYGKKQVEAGHYRDVISFDKHIAPLAKLIETHCDSLQAK